MAALLLTEPYGFNFIFITANPGRKREEEEEEVKKERKKKKIPRECVFVWRRDDVGFKRDKVRME